MPRPRLAVALAVSLLTLGSALAAGDQGMTLEPIEASNPDGSKGQKGFRVAKVEAESAAEQAGIRVDDLIVQMDGKPITDFKEARQRIRQGGEVPLTIYRDQRTPVPVILKAERQGGGAELKKGLLDAPAPAWDVETWRNLPEGKTTLDAADLKGKVVYVFCFQDTAAPCHKRGFPLVQELAKHYQGRDDVAVVAIQTAFEAFKKNAPERAWAAIETYGLTVPVGHSGRAGAPAPLLKSYQTGGVPWHLVIDREGKIRLSQNRLEAEEAIRLIDSLRG